MECRSIIFQHCWKVLEKCWNGVGMVLEWCWNGVGMVLGIVGHMSGRCGVGPGPGLLPPFHPHIEPTERRRPAVHHERQRPVADGGDDDDDDDEDGERQRPAIEDRFYTHAAAMKIRRRIVY